VRPPARKSRRQRRRKLNRYAAALTKNRSAADDLVQETMLRALEFQTSFRGEHVYAWLCTICRSRFMVSRRIKKTYREVEDPDGLHAQFLADDRPDPDSALDAAAALPAVFSLPEQYRVPLLRAAGGETCGQIAAAFGIPLGTTKNRIFRAREMLRDRFAAAGYDLPSPASAGGPI